MDPRVKAKAGSRSHKGKGRQGQYKLTGTKSVSHYSVTAWRRAIGGCTSWSSFQSQYGRQITATTDFCPVFVKLVCAPPLAHS